MRIWASSPCNAKDSVVVTVVGDYGEVWIFPHVSATSIVSHRRREIINLFIIGPLPIDTYCNVAVGVPVQVFFIRRRKLNWLKVSTNETLWNTRRYCYHRCRLHWCFQISCSSPHSSFWSSTGASSTSAVDRLHLQLCFSTHIGIAYQRMLVPISTLSPTICLQNKLFWMLRGGANAGYARNLHNE